MFGNVRKDDYAVLELMRIDEIEIYASIDIFERPLPRPHVGGYNRKTEFVDEIVGHKRTVETADPVFHDIFARLSFDFGDLGRHIALDQRGVPGNRLEGSGSDKFIQPIYAIHVLVALDLRPSGGEHFICDATEQEGVDVCEFLVGIFLALVVEERGSPSQRALDDTIERHETCHH